MVEPGNDQELLMMIVMIVILMITIIHIITAAITSPLLFAILAQVPRRLRKTRPRHPRHLGDATHLRGGSVASLASRGCWFLPRVVHPRVVRGTR